MMIHMTLQRMTRGGGNDMATKLGLWERRYAYYLLSGKEAAEGYRVYVRVK